MPEAYHRLLTILTTQYYILFVSVWGLYSFFQLTLHTTLKDNYYTNNNTI